LQIKLNQIDTIAEAIKLILAGSSEQFSNFCIDFYYRKIFILEPKGSKYSKDIRLQYLS